MITSLLNQKIFAKNILAFGWILLIASTTFSKDVSHSKVTLAKFLYSDIGNSQDDQVYDVVDKMPRPVGGQDGWEEYLAENLNYPSAALKSKIEGVVYVVFILEKDGRTSNVEVNRGIGAGCDEEAKRLVEGSPKWIPGKNNGESVRVRLRLPIRFHLPN